MHVVIERQSKAVQNGDGTEPRASRVWPFAVTGRARRSTKQPLYSRDEDPREGRDCVGVGPVSEEASQPLRHGDHPLPHRHRHRGNDAVDKMRSCLCHPAAVAGGTAAAALAREGLDKTLPARRTACPTESEAEDAAERSAPEVRAVHYPQTAFLPSCLPTSPRIATRLGCRTTRCCSS